MMSDSKYGQQGQQQQVFLQSYFCLGVPILAPMCQPLLMSAPQNITLVELSIDSVLNVKVKYMGTTLTTFMELY